MGYCLNVGLFHPVSDRWSAKTEAFSRTFHTQVCTALYCHILTRSNSLFIHFFWRVCIHTVLGIHYGGILHFYGIKIYLKVILVKKVVKNSYLNTLLFTSQWSDIILGIKTLRVEAITVVQEQQRFYLLFPSLFWRCTRVIKR